MGPQDRGLYIVEAEISVVLTAMKRGNLWNSNTNQDANTESLIKEFYALKKSLGTVESFSSLDTVEFLMPFLDVIRSEDVTGYVTGLALTAVNKFLAYDLIQVNKPNVSSAVENLADAVTHARFFGSDPSSDEVVLMKILEVLKLLILSKVGLLLTNESICEIMQSTLRICFEPRLSELLRKTAQHCLTDMVQLLFTRLPTFTHNQRPLLKKLKMRSSASDKNKRKTKSRSKKSASPTPRPDTLKTSPSSQSLSSLTPSTGTMGSQSTSTTGAEATSPTSVTPTVSTYGDESRGSVDGINFSVGGEVLARSPLGSVVDLAVVSDSETQGPLSDVEQQVPCGNDSVFLPAESGEQPKVVEGGGGPTGQGTSIVENTEAIAIQVTSPSGTVTEPKDGKAEDAADAVAASEAAVATPEQEFTNEAGVTFITTADNLDANGTLVPYGLPAVYELLRFLASLINVHDPQNTDQQIQIGLSLITCAFEVGVDSIGLFPSLMVLVKDDICRNLISLLSTERLAMFSAALRCCFLVFSSLRSHLKFQLEQFLTKLTELISSESQRISYEHKELSLELLVVLYKMPGFITELYLNYDCGLYTSNLFEDLTKVLSKNAYPVAGLLSTNHLALEGLLVVLDSIEKQCQRRISDRIPQPPPYARDRNTNNNRDSSLRELVESTPVMLKSSGHVFAMSTVPGNTNLKPTQQSETAIPTHESLMAIKHKKKLLSNGTDLFNLKPSKGIEYLQENRLLSKPTDPREVAHFLRENPHLCKNMIGEFISNKKNLEVLKSFVKAFDFRGLRIDEALRIFLSSFRLPGEAPLISMIMEIFGEHWHLSNDECLADADAPYTLAYAVIMLNTDQHNPNASKQNIPMTREQFIKNLRGTNGGGDHDPEMLAEIYHSIRNDEIIMPAEQTGLVKENYIWKQLLRRSDEEGDFLQLDNGMFDHNLFGLTWGPAVAALSYMFDKSNEPETLRRVLDGFSKCAMVAAHYAMSDVLDNVIISLTKFTTLLNTHETPENFKIVYGGNSKALLATRAVFSLTHKYGDILREGWRNLVECLLQMFNCQLLPNSLMEAEDYIESSGRVSLYREELPREKADTGLINSLVSFIVASSEVPRIYTREEEECIDVAKKTVMECHPEHLLAESKFLLTESLQELVRFLIAGSSLESNQEKADDHATLFYLELITRITIANRDRVMIIWTCVSDHISRLITATAPTLDTLFQLERAVTALLRLAVRLARKEENASTIVQSLRILLAMKPGSIFHVSKQISYGLHEFLRSNAANIHNAEDWAVIFSLLEVVGAGANPDNQTGLSTDDDSGQGADSEDGSSRDRTESGGWIDLGKEEKQKLTVKNGSDLERRYSIVHPRQIVMHDSISFLKCCDSLSFLVRDVVHITPENFPTCVAAIRTFVEASYKGELGGVGRTPSRNLNGNSASRQAVRTAVKKTPRNRQPPIRKIRSEPRNMDYDADEEGEDGEEDLTAEYTHLALQLLDLMYTLHTRAAGVHQAWAAEGGDSRGGEVDLWDTAWCPVLQGMARMCCDKRSEVRTQALNLLQRSLLIPDLQELQPAQWEFCFLRVLFPMLRKILEPPVQGAQEMSVAAREETKLRAAMMLSKVFLQHLSALSSLPTFTALWLTILDFLAQFVTTASSDLLADALPESLKNMLLVMDTSGKHLFFTVDGEATSLWTVTWEKIHTFLPGLKQEVFGEREEQQKKAKLESEQPQAPAAAADADPQQVEVACGGENKPPSDGQISSPTSVLSEGGDNKSESTTTTAPNVAGITHAVSAEAVNAPPPQLTSQADAYRQQLSMENKYPSLPVLMGSVGGPPLAASSPPPVSPNLPPILSGSIFSSLPNSPSHSSVPPAPSTHASLLLNNQAMAAVQFAPITPAPCGPPAVPPMIDGGAGVTASPASYFAPPRLATPVPIVVRPPAIGASQPPPQHGSVMMSTATAFSVPRGPPPPVSSLPPTVAAAASTPSSGAASQPPAINEDNRAGTSQPEDIV